MTNKKFKVSYDKDGDVLTFYREEAKVEESVEVTEEMIIDLDKEGKIVGVELLEAYQFLHTINEKITQELLSAVQEAELQFKKYRNYWIITLVFEEQDQRIEEKLPAFASMDFQSPLVASAAA